MEFKETHLLNALLPIEVTENGTLIVFNEQYANALFSINIIDDEFQVNIKKDNNRMFHIQ